MDQPVKKPKKPRVPNQKQHETYLKTRNLPSNVVILSDYKASREISKG
jgi:hypothetical protein